MMKCPTFFFLKFMTPLQKLPTVGHTRNTELLELAPSVASEDRAVRGRRCWNARGRSRVDGALKR